MNKKKKIEAGKRTLLQKTFDVIKENIILEVIVLLFIIYVAVKYRKGNTDQLQFAIDWIMTAVPSQKKNLTKAPTAKPFWNKFLKIKKFKVQNIIKRNKMTSKQCGGR